MQAIHLLLTVLLASYQVHKASLKPSLILLMVCILEWRRVHFLRWVRVSSLRRGRVHFLRWVWVSRLGWVCRHLIGRWLSLLDISFSKWVGILLGTLLLGACCDNSGGGRNRLCGSCNSGLSTSRRYTTPNDNADDNGDDHKDHQRCKWCSDSSPNSISWRGYKE